MIVVVLLIFVIYLMMEIAALRERSNQTDLLRSPKTPDPQQTVTPTSQIPQKTVHQQTQESKLAALRQIYTRGKPREFESIGILTQESTSKVLALYGRQIYPSSPTWHYYSMSDGFQRIELQVRRSQDSDDICRNSVRGCDKIQDDDLVYLDGFELAFTASLYRK